MRGIRARHVWVPALVALTLVFGLTVYSSLIFAGQGPLGTTAGNVAEARVVAGTTVAVSYPLPDERLKAPIKIRDIRLIDKDPALRVLRAAVVPCRAATSHCAPSLIHRSWPPGHDSLVPVEGYVLSKGGNPYIAVALAIPAGARGTYSVRGAVLEYTQGMRRFRTELGPVIRLHAKPPHS